MIRRVCCVCGIQYGTKEQDKPGDMVSHGLCQQHFLEAMANIERQFAELPADLAHGEVTA